MSRGWRLPDFAINHAERAGGGRGGRGGRGRPSGDDDRSEDSDDSDLGWPWEEAAAAAEAAGASAVNAADLHFQGLARRLSPFAPRTPNDLPVLADAERSLTQCTREFTWRSLRRNFSSQRRALCESESEVEFCRICREGGGREPLIAPCDCRGTVRYVHKSCLERWLGESDTSYCEICGLRYITERSPRYGLLKSLLLWAMTSHQDLLIDLLTLFTFMPLAVLGTSMGVSASRSLCYGLLSEPDDEGVSNLMLLVEPRMGPMAAQVRAVVRKLACVGAQTMTVAMVAVMAAMDIAVCTWLVLRIQQHMADYYSWWRRQSMVRLVLPQRQRLMEEQETEVTSLDTPIEYTDVTEETDAAEPGTVSDALDVHDRKGRPSKGTPALPEQVHPPPRQAAGSSRPRAI